jgi:ABC-type branched-subunit amino acid transport system ATPase component
MSALVEIDNVSVQFTGLRAVSNVSFEVSRGEVCAVIGPNGAGKSTLFNAIGGYVKLASGTVRLDGEELSGKPVHRIAAAGVRRTFQNGGLFQDLTVLENVLVGLHQTHSVSLGAALVSTLGARRREQDAIRQARETLSVLGINALEQSLVRDLASGQQRMVEIARALASPAKLLMLDEPAVGLTTLECERLGRILRDLAARGIAILLVEHVLDLVMSVSDKVIVLNYGEALAEGTPTEIRQNPAVLEAYLGHG